MAVRKHISPAELFEELGVNTEAPGFCDDPRFLEAEPEHPQLLEEYAAFIRGQRFRVEYLGQARNTVRAAADFLHERLIEDGRTGACIDVNMVLSRFLDQQGVWNYINRGALSIFFDKPTGLGTVRFGPITLSDNPATAGHTWLYAPPFQIVDITVSIQNYPGGEAKHVPKDVITQNVKRSTFDALDLMDPDSVSQFRLATGRAPTLEDLEELDPGITERVRRFGAVEVKHGRTRLRYVTPAIGGCKSGPLENFRNLCLSGKYPAELYEEFTRSLVA